MQWIMATSLKNLSDYDVNALPSAKGMKVGIVVAEWNSEITFAMCEGAKNLLIKNGASCYIKNNNGDTPLSIIEDKNLKAEIEKGPIWAFCLHDVVIGFYRRW